MRKLAFIAVLALLGVTGSALAAKPPHPSTPASPNANANRQSATAPVDVTANALAAQPTPPSTPATTNASSKGQSATVLFVLRGTLGLYTPANGSTSGSIMITVKASNHEAALLEGQTLTFPVSSDTKIVGTVTSGDAGIVKVHAAKNAPAATLQTLAAFQVIDQGARP